MACAAIAAVVSFNALRLDSHQGTVAPLVPPAVDAGAAAGRLAGAVRLRTISYDEPSAASLHEMRAMHAYLEVAFPRTHQALRREVVNDYSLLYTWTGQDPAEKPIVFMAHQDVVPIAPGSESRWHAGPFSGEIREGLPRETDGSVPGRNDDCDAFQTGATKYARGSDPSTATKVADIGSIASPPLL